MSPETAVCYRRVCHRVNSLGPYPTCCPCTGNGTGHPWRIAFEGVLPVFRRVRSGRDLRSGASPCHGHMNRDIRSSGNRTCELELFAFGIATAILLWWQVPRAACSLIHIRNRRFTGGTAAAGLFQRREYPLDFVPCIRVDGGHIEMEFGPPPETSLFTSARPAPRFWHSAHGLDAEEQEDIAARLRMMVTSALAADCTSEGR